MLPVRAGTRQKPCYLYSSHPHLTRAKSTRSHKKSLQISILGAICQIECAAVHGCYAELHRTLDVRSGGGWTNMTFKDFFPAEQRRRMVPSLILLLAVFSSDASEIEVTVLNRDGEPIPNVAVYVQSEHDTLLPAPTDTVVLDQIDTRFVPHLLVVQTGTQVEFSNSDVIAHHIYSFSRPYNFVLPMSKGDLKPKVYFEHGGVVTLGCDIHDHMLAYIFVVDSNVFGKTNFDGKTQLTTDNAGGLTVSIWSPRIKLNEEELTQTIKAGRSAQLTFSLTEKLRAAHSDEWKAFSWNNE